ncbi:GIY-YIG nuclease family protein [Patescibacteria group bacterium]|nr:GIY-YIG nuclease family protein [Patescibacteria group bacterium]MBU1922438.1 GIY-YIG nuclease family protein [Patescibacteria group bacterium]
MSYKVYIIRSKKTGRYYIGSAEDENIRLKKHNAGRVRSTKPCRPWEIIRVEEYPTRQQAYKREVQIKRYKGGEAFKKLVNKDKNKNKK